MLCCCLQQHHQFFYRLTKSYKETEITVTKYSVINCRSGIPLNSSFAYKKKLRSFRNRSCQINHFQFGFAKERKINYKTVHRTMMMIKYNFCGFRNSSVSTKSMCVLQRKPHCHPLECCSTTNKTMKNTHSPKQ